MNDQLRGKIIAEPIAKKPLPQIISRDEAHRLGKVKFFTGERCKRGHISERYVSTGGCVECLTKTYKRRQNAFSSALVAFRSETLWVPSTVPSNRTGELEKYMQECIYVWCAHHKLLTPELEEALRNQIARM